MEAQERTVYVVIDYGGEDWDATIYGVYEDGVLAWAHAKLVGAQVASYKVRNHLPPSMTVFTYHTNENDQAIVRQLGNGEEIVFGDESFTGKWIGTNLNFSLFAPKLTGAVSKSVVSMEDAKEKAEQALVDFHAEMLKQGLPIDGSVDSADWLPSAWYREATRVMREVCRSEVYVMPGAWRSKE